jgi:hypothetical protein
MVDTATGNGATFNTTMSLPGSSNLFFGAGDITLGCSSPLQGTNTDPTDVTDSSFIPQLNTWYNVICIYHKGSGTVYINGQLSKFYQSPSGTTANLCSNSSIIVGGWWNGDPVTLNGKMDEVRMYNRVLTPHEIVTLSQHYQITSEKITPTPVKGSL